VYRNPQERERTLREIYESEDGLEPAVLEGLHRTQRAAYRAQARRLTRVAGEPGAGLEVGSYVGAFLAAAREAGWRFEGVDINEAAVCFARGKGFTVTEGTIDAIPSARRFDAVAIWNCLDQLADPRHVVARARALLVPHGIVAVRVPNGEAYARWRDAAVAEGGRIARAVLAHNNLLTFPYRYGFTLRSLTRLLRGAGLLVTSVYGDTLVPIADRYTRPWASAEERLVKGALRLARRLRITSPSSSPWIEVYARATT
jgi:SAM-dependent methyltransferase